MPTFANGESAASVRTKINDAIDKVDGAAAISSINVDGGTIDGTVIGGASAAAGTFTTATATTGNITTVNATTVDATDVEVTNIKAKDGTASATIADSTGVMTIASSVLTTADINGGTIDGVTIGGASAGAGTFTTLTATGDVDIADKIVHTGDTNTAIRFPAADTVTVETAGVEALRIDSSQNVGIGASSAGSRLEVSGAMYVPATNFKGVISAYSTDAQAAGTGAGLTLGGVFTGSAVTPFAQVAGIKENSTSGNYAGALALYSRPNGDTLKERMRISSGGDISFYEDTGTTPLFFWDASNERLGIGTSSPSQKLTVAGDITTSGNGYIRSVGTGSDTAGAGPNIGVNDSTNTNYYIQQLNASAGLDWWYYNAGWNKRMTLDSSGNVGIGVTPSAWGSGYRVFQIGDSALSNFGTGYALLSQNALFGASSNTYINSAAASYYRQFLGAHAWFNAPSGTAGNAITFTQAMTLDASGNLGLGDTSPASYGKLAITRGNSTAIYTQGADTTAGFADIYIGRSGTASFNAGQGSALQLWNSTSSKGVIIQSADDNLQFLNYGGSAWNERFRIDGSGNVGIGVTPSAWGSQWKSLDINNGGMSLGGTAETAHVSANAYNDGAWKYKLTSIYGVSYYKQFNGEHSWYNAPSGTAGNAITFTQAMTLDASGNLVVGDTSALGGGKVSTAVDLSAANGFVVKNTAASYGPTHNLFRAINSSSAQVGGLTHTAATDMGVWGYSNLILSTGASATERLRIDSSGRVGIGVTPSAWSSAYRTIESGVSGGNYGVFWSSSNTDGGANSYGQVGIGNNNSTGSLYAGNGASSFYLQSGGRHSWFNAPSGTAGNAITFTQAMTLDASGNLLIGTTTEEGALTVKLNRQNQDLLKIRNTATANAYGASIQFTATAANINAAFRIAENDSTIVFNIAGNGNVTNTNNSYGAISDAKLKENITDATPKLDKLNQVRVVSYNLKTSPEQKLLGVVAQELEQIFPGMVEEAVDRDAEGNDLGTTTKSVKYSVFVPMLIKAMQEQQAIIEDLKARLDAANL